MVQTERDSHSVTHYEIHCWIYSIIRGLRFPLKFLWTESNLVCAFGHKAAGSLSCYLPRIEGNQHIGLRVFPSSVFCILFLLNIYMATKKNARSFSLPQSWLIAFWLSPCSTKTFQSKISTFQALAGSQQPNIIGAYQILGVGKTLCMSGQFVLCWKKS